MENTSSSTFSEIVSRAVDLRHDLHRHPERSWKEAETATRIRDELARLDIKFSPCANTGTVADLGPSEGARIALRADIDALPLDEKSGVPHQSINAGVMHACGHDGHSASLLATAAWFKEHEAALTRPIRLIFQPAEEGGHGAKKMIEEGCLRGVSEIFGYHNMPTMPFGKAAAPAGPVMVSNGYFCAVIHGQGGHASTPEMCRDPILAAAQFVTLVQQVVSRNVAPQVAAVVTVSTFHGGTARNIIPDSVKLEGTVRAESEELRDRLAQRVADVLDSVCRAAEVTAEYDFAPAYGATINHASQARTVQTALIDLLGEDALETTGIPFMGAEDFSYYLKEVPGAYALIGAGRGETSAPLHSPRFDFNDDLIALVVQLWSKVVGAPLPA